ncbi:MAG: TonB-dependent receptor, partial [Bacteroidales bacterium]|nr:TonB-dependent receptor [Bacteroidales bacterium]
ARMASNFAGVQEARDGGNAIVIRGNSPIGMLWRMEGVDIPNPNHFSYAEMTSGSISMINNNLLSNSDFFTGAFPAEYGNAISGVFDLHLRNGNNQKHEFLGQIGMAGFELGAEGPISKSQGSSYLINYRYSTLGLMYKLGFDFGTGGAVPFYQDITAKINLPTSKAGKFSMFVLAGISNIDMIDSELDTTEQDEFDIYSEYEQDIYSKTKTGIVGLSHQFRLNNTSYTKLIISTSYHQNKAMLDSLSTETRDVIPYHRGTKDLTRSSVRLFYHKKFSAKDNIRVGAIAQSRGFSMLDSTFLGEHNSFHTTMDFDGEAWLLQPYVQWKHKFNNRLTTNIGVHGEFLTLNNRYSIEPRAGISYKMRPNQKLSLAYGLHSYMLPMFIYQNKIYHEQSDSYVIPNQDLDFTKSHHLVLGYDYNINATLRFKTELYYQGIYDAAVDFNPGTFSSLNFGTNLYSMPDTLVNGGTGTNYGIEITLQQLMNKGLYYLATVSLYDSKYKGSDKIERNTVFNSNYAVNVVGGKEFLLHKKKEKKSSSIAIDGRVVWAGGYRYAPVDVEKSRQYKMTHYDNSSGYSKQLDDYFRADIRIMFKKNVKGHSEEYGLDIQNITNRKNPLHAKYDSATNSEKIATLAGIMPMMMFRITF